MPHAVSIKLNSIVLSEVNYKYELQTSINSCDRIAQCYLLLGTQQDKISTITKCLQIPINLNESEGFKFTLDLELFHQRYVLVKQVENIDTIPLGIMLVNDRYFSYNNIIESVFLLNKLGFTVPINILFKYKPLDTRNEGDDLELECLIRDQNSIIISFIRTIYELVEDSKVKITNDILNQNDQKLSNVNVELNDRIHKNINDYSSHAFEQFNKTNEGENELVVRLMKKVNKIISFLKEERIRPNKGIIDDDYELILRRLSLLISQLQRSNTEDIENEIINKENEIKILQIACNQWEMVTPH